VTIKEDSGAASAKKLIEKLTADGIL